MGVDDSWKGLTLQITQQTAIALPFSISRGKVTASTDTPTIWQDKVSFAVGTMKGERVLRSSYGSTIPSRGFDSSSSVSAAIYEEVKGIFNQQFPSLVLTGVTTDVSTEPGTVYVNISYILPDQTQDAVRVGIARIQGNSLIRETTL